MLRTVPGSATGTCVVLKIPAFLCVPGQRVEKEKEVSRGESDREMST